MTNEVTLTITLTKDQLTTFNEIKKTRDGRSDQDIFNQIVDRGLYDISYRTRRNKIQWSQFKAWKNSQTE